MLASDLSTSSSLRQEERTIEAQVGLRHVAVSEDANFNLASVSTRTPRRGVGVGSLSVCGAATLLWSFRSRSSRTWAKITFGCYLAWGERWGSGTVAWADPQTPEFRFPLFRLYLYTYIKSIYSSSKVSAAKQRTQKRVLAVRSKGRRGWFV